MFEFKETEVCRRWYDRLRDPEAQSRIDTRLRRMRRGNLGDARPVGGGVSELRIDYGPGYRVYFVRSGRSVILLLAGGDKSRRNRDITRAQQIARDMWKESQR